MKKLSIRKPAETTTRNLLLDRLQNQELAGVRNWSRDELYERTLESSTDVMGQAR